MRQFGFKQNIPNDCDTDAKLHKVDLRSKKDPDWSVKHARFIQIWNDGGEQIEGEPDVELGNYDDLYMNWFRRITRRFISPVNVYYEFMVC